MLKDMGCSYVILGHSERRICLGETDKEVEEKVREAKKASLVPIVCVGETREEREKGETKDVLKRELKVVEKGVIVAYEPIWAIGKGEACSAEKAGEVLSFIKSKKEVSVLYGGSVDSGNIKGLTETGFDGVLVGGSSLKPREFLKIGEALAS